LTDTTEDRRRICRERAILLRERVRHVNRVKGLLSGQGVVDYEPLERDRRTRLDELTTGDGRPLPPRLKAELIREIELIERIPPGGAAWDRRLMPPIVSRYAA
jgi:transposase